MTNEPPVSSGASVKSRLLSTALILLILAGAVMLVLPFLFDEETVGGRSERPPVGQETARDVKAAEPFAEHHFERLISDPRGVLYGISRHDGLLVSYDDGVSWVPRNQGLPRKLIYPFKTRSLRRLAAVTVDPVRPGRVAVATAGEVLLSDDGGQRWRSVLTADPPSKYYFTSVGLDPADAAHLLVGSSFSGFLESLDGGATWRHIAREAGFLYRGIGLYEEVSGIAADPAREGGVVIAAGFTNGIYRWAPGSAGGEDGTGDREVEDLQFPAAGREWIQSMYVTENPRPRLTVMTNRRHWVYEFGSKEWRKGSETLLSTQPPIRLRDDKRRRLERATGRTGIYINPVNASGQTLLDRIGFLLEHGLNTMVVDCKDDMGKVVYDSALELPRRTGALQPRFRLDELVRLAHEKGLYVVARLPIFKDRYLYRYDNYAYAVWDGPRNAPWAHLISYEDEETGQTRLYQREYWADPFSSFVREYNLRLARELARRGVDEIQFDYVRFPTDGDLSTAVYRHRKPGMTPIDALESFLAQAREWIDVPISADLYGFNSWYRMGGRNGQDIEMFSDYVDVICPMFYPSHFPAGFKEGMPYLERARRLYYEGTRRAMQIVDSRSLIRPYVQAFLLRSMEPEKSMGRSEYVPYLRAQLEGLLRARASGYTLWNSSNDYYMVRFSLAGYQPGR